MRGDFVKDRDVKCKLQLVGIARLGALNCVFEAFLNIHFIWVDLKCDMARDMAIEGRFYKG